MLRLPDAWVVAVDTETSGLHQDDGARVSTVVLSWAEEEGGHGKMAIPFDQGRLGEKMPYMQLDLFEDPDMDPNLGEDEWQRLLEWLAGRDLLVMHNGKFDLHMLEAGTRHWPGRRLDQVEVWDTMVAAKQLDPLLPVGLDAVGERLGFGGKTGKNAVAEWLKARKLPKGRYDLVPWDIMEPYALGDADQTIRVYEWQQNEAESRGSTDKIHRENAVMRVLQKTERRGIPYDAASSSAIADQLEQRIAELEAARPFGEGEKAARHWFFSVNSARVIRKTEGGTASLDEQTTRAMVKDGIPWAAEYAELQSLKTAASLWYRGYADKTGEDGRLRTSFRQTKVISGRMSVERVNLQAIPKQNKVVARVLGMPADVDVSVRGMIRAEPGRMLVNMDLQQAELRVAAKFAGCARMLEMLASGEDLHSITTKAVLGVDETHPDWKMKRDTGKRLTFASIFQVGGQTMMENLADKADIHMSLADCNQMVQRWRATYPEFGDAYRKAERIAKSRGYVRVLPNTPYEDRSYFGEFDFHNTAWSRMVQGSLAEALKIWWVQAEEAFPEAIVLSVHDSILVEGDEATAEATAHGIAQMGEHLLTSFFNIPMQVEVSPWRS